jgi:hypothetical protein
LKKILEEHRRWRESGETEGARANLAGANLAGAYLDGANLAGANLDGANLAGANLAGAYLAGAYLAGANLAGAYLDGANLAGANLDGANLAGANLAGANLAGAYLAGAYLARAKIQLSEQIVKSGAWSCHKWDNCPMAEAFNIHTPEDGPLLLQPRIKQFVKFFDAGLIPEPKVAPAETSETKPSESTEPKTEVA